MYKNNKIFITLLLGAVVLSGTSFEMQGSSYQKLGQWAGSVGQSISNVANAGYQAFVKNLPGRETMSTWANKAVSMLSENRKEALFAALALALGGSYYAYQQYISHQKKETAAKEEAEAKEVLEVKSVLQLNHEGPPLRNIRKILDQYVLERVFSLSQKTEKMLKSLLKLYEEELPFIISADEWIRYASDMIKDYIADVSSTLGEFGNSIDQLNRRLAYLQCWQKHTTRYQDNQGLKDAIKTLTQIRTNALLRKNNEF